jgi:hypothetical protein
MSTEPKTPEPLRRDRKSSEGGVVADAAPSLRRDRPDDSEAKPEEVREKKEQARAVKQVGSA